MTYAPTDRLHRQFPFLKVLQYYVASLTVQISMSVFYFLGCGGPSNACLSLSP